MVACPATTTTTDAGTDAATFDEPLPCQPDASPDASDDVQPTHPPFQNACSPAQISDYAQCQGQKMTSLCEQFKPGGPGEACGKCIETAAESPLWGVIVFKGSTASMNVEGCVDDALGTTECGDALHRLYQCEEIVCSACTGGDFRSCELQATESPQGFCKGYSDTVLDPTGPCAAINGDAGLPCAVQNCFPNTACTDTTRQQVDWLARIVAYMCGAPTTDCPVGSTNPCP